jgi:hypothetical protein
LACAFSFQFADVRTDDQPRAAGTLTVVPSLDSLSSDLPSILNDLSAAIGDKPTTTAGGPLNVLHSLSQMASTPTTSRLKELLQLRRASSGWDPND